MATPNYNLPTISGNMTADVVRDMNALATATDGAIKTAVSSIDLTKIDQVDSRLTAHLEDSMPHKYVDGGKTYRWGFRTVNGEPQMIYEEVIA